MENKPTEILYRKEWKTPIICEKPEGVLRITQESSKFHHQGGYFIADIYVMATKKHSWGYFNFHDHASDGKGNPVYPERQDFSRKRIDAMPSDEWYKISL